MRRHYRFWIRIHLLIVGVILTGTLGYRLIEGASWMDGLFMTFITVTTIGYGEVVHLSPVGRIFTMILGLGGIGVIFWVATEFAREIIEGEIQEMLGLRRKTRMLRSLKNHHIVCGYGRVGRWVVDTFLASRQSILVIDQKHEHIQELTERNIPSIVGDASTEQILKEARIEQASSIVVCLPEDAFNVYTVLLARQLNPKIRIIARSIDEGAEQRLKMAGADRVMNPYRLGGNRLALSAMKPAVVDFLELSLHRKGGDLLIEELELGEGSSLVGKTLAEAELRKRFHVIVVSVRRGARDFFNPGPEQLLQAHDVLVVVGPESALDLCKQATQT